MKVWAVTKVGKPVEFIDRPNPMPTGTEVVLDVTHCGVCHSDLHFCKGEYQMGGGKIMNLTDRGVELPRAPGHEVFGRVVAAGPDAEGIAIGDQRIVYPWIGCGHCKYCKSENDNMCATQSAIGVIRHGGFGEKVMVPHPRYLVEADGIDPALASTFACSGITTLSAIRKLGEVPLEQAVVLIGAGGLGHAAISMLHALGHQAIVVVDIDPAKRVAALTAGATAVVDGSRGDVVEAIKNAVGGPVLSIIDFVNNTETAQSAYASLAKGGKLIMVGVAGGDLTLGLAEMIFKGLSIMGSVTGSIQDLRDIVALAQKGKLNPVPIVRMSKDQANEALDMLRAGQAIGRIVLEGSREV